jgi:hypothetical protein
MTNFTAYLPQVGPVEVWWESADEGVATVDAEGFATGRSAGQVFLRAQREGIVGDSALLNVLTDTSGVALVTISPGDTSVSPGDSILAIASALSYHGQPIVVAGFTWFSSDTNVARVSSQGGVKARSPGFTVLRALVEQFQSAPALLRVTARVRTGSFVGFSGTPVSGTATLENVDGTSVLRFADDFQCESGPSLYVYLSNSSAITAASLEIAPLKSVAGAQAYTIPAGVGSGDYGFAVIHCKPYNHTFGYAELD